jgi:midasin
VSALSSQVSATHTPSPSPLPLLLCRVYVELLGPQDLSVIASSLHPRLPRSLLDRMVALLNQLDAAANGTSITSNNSHPSLQHGGTNVMSKGPQGTGAGGARFASQGGPWEFNLRDLLRWANLVEGGVAPPPAPAEAVTSHTAPAGPASHGGSSVAAMAGEAAEHAALDEAAEHYARMLFAHRLRTPGDRERFAQVGGCWSSAEVVNLT